MAVSRALRMSCQPAGIAQVDPGSAPVCQRQRRLGQTELGGQRQGPVGVRDGVTIVSPDYHPPPGLAGQRPDQVGGRAERLDQGQGLGGQGPVTRVAQPLEDAPVAGHRPGQGDDIAPAAEQLDGLLIGARRLGQPSPLAQRIAVAGQQLRALRVTATGQLQRAGVVTFGRGHVDAQGPVPGQHQVAHRRGGQLPGQGILGGAGQVQGGDVVGGQDVGVVASPVPGYGLDPGRGALGGAGRGRPAGSARNTPRGSARG